MEVQMAVTISDVAAQAGVSKTTVSHTLNRPHRVSAKTRAKVLAVVDALGYYPHELAERRQRASTPRIAVVAPFTSYSSFHERLDGLLNRARHGDGACEVVLVDHGSAARSADPQLSVLPLQGRVDGIVVMGLPVDDAWVERVQQHRLPAVLVDSRHPELDTVTMNDELGGKLAAQHLLTRGLTEFVYVSEGQVSSYPSAAQRRMLGFQQALAEAGMGRQQFRHLKVPDGLAAAEERGLALARRGRDGLGIFAHHDRVAVGLLNGLRAGRVKVPGDHHLVGFDGRELARAAKLTTIRQPLAESGTLGMELLLRRIADPDLPVTHTMMNVELIEGETT
ncbi:LacI family transcriptional regulator [Enemella evansiae]|nr:LacI family transcriptional regulator [Enemella evansiae]